MANDSSATIRVGDEFSLTGEGVYKGTAKSNGAPYIMVIKKAERGFSSVKMFIYNATECLNAQSVKITKILDAVSSPHKAPNGKVFSEFKITAVCEPHDVLATERKDAVDEFEMFINTDPKAESGLFDKYSDGNELPFA